MNIESSLERIADALDCLATEFCGKKALGAAQNAKPEAPKAVKAPVVEEQIPGMGFQVGPSIPLIHISQVADAMTSKDLRDMAQKYIQAAGEKTQPIIKFIQGVAKKFNPAEPKLIKIPDAKAAEAAKMIENECARQGITIPVEV